MEQQQQPVEQNQNQENKPQSTSQKKKELQRIIELNKKIQRFIETLQRQHKNKQVHEYLLIQKQQQSLINKDNQDIKGLIVNHHGNGDQKDYDGLKVYFNKFGENTIVVFPAFSYAYVQFKDREALFNSIQDLGEQPFDQIFKYKKGVEQKQYYDNEDQQYHIKLNQMNFINFRMQEHTRYVFYCPTDKDISFFESKAQNKIPNATRHIEIPGLYLIKDFITEEQEKLLKEEADQGEWSNLNKRLVQHYGHEFLYGSNKVDNKDIKPFPEQAQKLATQIEKQLEKQSGNSYQKFDQLTINSYEPGDGIAPHVDAHEPFEEWFCALSTGDGIVMSFRNIQDIEKHIFFPKRTLILFSGEARYAWQHSIATRKIDKVDNEMHFRARRISYTFRTLRNDKKCGCNYEYFCDSRGFDQNTMNKLKFNSLKPKGLNADPNGNTVFARNEEEVKMFNEIQENFKKTQLNNEEDNKGQEEEKEETKQLVPSEVEKKYVYEVYDKIAPHFSATRYKPWPKVTKFLDSIPEGSLVADVGCGNGKYLSCKQNQNGDFFMIGTDRSRNLIEICREREQTCQVFSADSLKLPWKSGLFDAVISIAVIHHFSNDELRCQALSEIHRIMDDNGRALIYVWAFEQENKNFQEQDVFVPWHNQFRFEEQVENKDKNKQNQQEGQQQEQQQQQEEVKEEDMDDQDKARLKREQAEKHKDKEQNEAVSKVDADKQSVVYKRYYHVFKEGELLDLIAKFGKFDVQESYYDHANWCVIVTKKKNN